MNPSETIAISSRRRTSPIATEARRRYPHARFVVDPELQYDIGINGISFTEFKAFAVHVTETVLNPR